VGTSTKLYTLDLKPSIFDGKYELLSSIGRGKNSVVHRALRVPEKREASDSSPEPVALKILTNTERRPEEAVKRMQKEARALVALNHPNVIKSYNYVARRDCCYLSLEYAKHGDLAKLINDSPQCISAKSAVRILRAVLSGLSHIHSNNIIHRDIKLENILVTKSLEIKIADFSAAQLESDNADLSLANNFIGTLEYVAPECLRGVPYSTSSDLFAAGVTFFKLITGFFPFEGKSISQSIIYKQKGDFSKELSDQLKKEFPGLEAYLLTLLSPEPNRRFGSAKEAKAALATINEKPKTTVKHDTNGYVKPESVEMAINIRKRNSNKLKDIEMLAITFAGTMLIFLGVFYNALEKYYLR